MNYLVDWKIAMTCHQTSSDSKQHKINRRILPGPLRCATRATSLIPIVVIILFACRQPEQQLTPVTDFLSYNGTPHAKAQHLRDSGLFRDAASAFRNAFEQSQSDSARAFCRANDRLCSILAGDTTVTIYQDNEYRTSAYSAVDKLTRAVHKLNNDTADFQLLYASRDELSSQGLHNSFYSLITSEYLGLAHKRKGAYIDSAQLYFRQSLELIRRNPKLENQSPRILYQLAALTLINRDEVSGLGYIEQALRFEVDRSMRVQLLTLQGTLFRKLKRLEEARGSYEMVGDLVPDVKKKTLHFNYLRELAIYSIYVRDDSSARHYLQRLRELATTLPGQGPIADFLEGLYYYRANDKIAVIRCYERALKGFIGQSLPETPIMMEVLYVLAEFNLDRGDFANAERYAYQSLVQLTELKQHPYTWENVVDRNVASELYNFIAYDQLAKIYLKRYQKSYERDYLHQSFFLYRMVDSLMSQQVNVHEEEAVIQFLGIGHGIYTNALDACHEMFTLYRDTTLLNAAHRFMEHGKALMLYRDLLTNDQTYFPNVPEEFRSRELELKSNLASIKRRRPVDTKALSSALKELEIYFSQMKAAYPEYYLSKKQFTVHDFAHHHRESNIKDESILQYHVSNDKLFVLRYDSPIQFRKIMLPADFSEQLNKFRLLFLTPNDVGNEDFKNEFIVTSHKLFKMLIEPMGALREQLTIIPDGPISNVPFECLARDSSAAEFRNVDFLLNSHSIAYATSLKTIDATNSINNISSVLAYGFTTNVRGKMTSLPGAIKELNVVAGRFSNTTLRKGERSTRDQFLEDIKTPYDVIHLALHASSSDQNRFDNKIFFPREQLVDTLYGFQIVPMKIEAKVVVLTACESAAGTHVAGEGTFNLARSFRQAGAKNVISSLWPMADHSAPMLMDSFYENLKAGDEPALALRKSKLDFLKKSNNVTASPFFWAGLVSN